MKGPAKSIPTCVKAVISGAVLAVGSNPICCVMVLAFALLHCGHPLEIFLRKDLKPLI